MEPNAIKPVNPTPYRLGFLFRRSKLSIGTRLTACFVVIVLSMIVGNVVVIWQFRQVAVPVQRLSNADQVSLAVVRVHLDMDTFRDKVAALASNHDIHQFAGEAPSLRRKFLADIEQADQALRLAPQNEQHATISSALQTLKVTLPAQLDTVVELATAGDWTAVRLRLAGQIQDFIQLGSLLVERVNEQVLQERIKAVESTQQARRHFFIVVPVAGLLTLLAAAALGWYVTRTITVPLSEVTAGAQALARGDFEHKVEVGGDDELAVLARAFNYAARQLQELYQSLRDGEEQWRAAFESNPTMYFMLDGRGTILSVNAFGAEQLGYESDELVGQPVLTVIHATDRDVVQKRANDCFEQPGRTLRWEARKVRKDGTVLWVRETANAVSLKNQPVLLVVCEDITHQKRAEEALKRSEAYLAEAQRLSHTGSWAWDPRTDKTLYCSEEIYRIFGLDPRQGLPSITQLLERVHPEDRERVRQTLELQIAEGSTDAAAELHYRLVMPDGEVKFVRSIRQVVFDQTGAATEVIGTVVDVTELKRVEQERERLRKLEADLAHMNRLTMLGELASSLAHEINQPIAATITSANACLRWLARNPPEVERACAAAIRIEKDGNRAAEIIQRLRAFYKTGAPPQRESVDINEVIGEMVVLLRDEATGHSISFRTELAPQLPQIMADRVQLQQVLMNLMLNGIEAMKDGGGELTMRSQRTEDGLLLISVSDTGVGLSHEKADLIFNAFYTTKPQGTGMGLAISRSIIEAHGGRLWATPNGQRGATFHFTVPAEVRA